MEGVKFGFGGEGRTMTGEDLLGADGRGFEGIAIGRD